jgi:hypothetical protein
MCSRHNVSLNLWLALSVHDTSYFKSWLGDKLFFREFYVSLCSAQENGAVVP